MYVHVGTDTAVTKCELVFCHWREQQDEWVIPKQQRERNELVVCGTEDALKTVTVPEEITESQITVIGQVSIYLLMCSLYKYCARMAVLGVTLNHYPLPLRYDYCYGNPNNV